jgi:hypothetical protein
MSTRTHALLCAGVLAVAGCATAPLVDDPTRIRGRIDGTVGIPKEALVEVYRVGMKGAVQVEPLEYVRPDRLGRFHSRVLAPGQYVTVYRPPDLPPSIAHARVPSHDTVALRPAVTAGLVQLRITPGPGITAVTRCRLTQADPPEAVPDRRVFALAPLGIIGPVYVRGLQPGRWRLDLIDTAQTTEIVLPATDEVRELAVDPPPLSPGAFLTGEVRLTDAGPATGLVVTVRGLGGTEWIADAWGRYCVVPPSGHYEIHGIPPGRSLVRVESRETVYRGLPSPQQVSISPSGRLELGFIVRP